MSPTQIEGIVPNNQCFKKRKIGQYETATHREIGIVDDNLLQIQVHINLESIRLGKEVEFYVLHYNGLYVLL